MILSFFCAHKAKLRGRNPFVWFAIGFTFGLLGLLILYLLPPLTSQSLPKVYSSIEPRQKPLFKSSQKLWYYLNSHNQRFGPMSLERLKEIWIENQIFKKTYVWNEEMKDWKLVEELPNLLAHLESKI